MGIFLSRKLKACKVTEIRSPDPWLQGRAGMVRCRSKNIDITAVVAYPPPDMGNRQRTKAAVETMSWVRKKLEELPSRTLPIVGCDNVGVADEEAEGIGKLNLSAQGTGGTECLKIVNDLGMAMPGTDWEEAGPNYHPAFGRSTTPDHWLAV